MDGDQEINIRWVFSISKKGFWFLLRNKIKLPQDCRQTKLYFENVLNTTFQNMSDSLALLPLLYARINDL